MEQRRALNDHVRLDDSGLGGSNYDSSKEVKDIFDQIKQSIDQSMVEENQAVYQFDIKGKGSYFIDLKNGNGNAGPGKPLSKPDVILSVDVGNFKDIFSGKLKPNIAVTLGKLKVGGSTAKAIKLEKLLPKFRGDGG